MLYEERRRFPEPKRSGLSPLPREGGTGWVEGEWDQRLTLSPFIPSQSPLFKGETQEPATCFLIKQSALPHHGGWKDAAHRNGMAFDPASSLRDREYRGSRR